MTVDRQSERMPSFLSSPRSGCIPSRSRVASFTIRSRISSGVRLRPSLAGGVERVSPLPQRRNVRGETIVIRSLMAVPTSRPNLTIRCRSTAEIVIRFGNLARRIPFSSLRYWTCLASVRSVAVANKRRKEWKSFVTGIKIPKWLPGWEKTLILTTAGTAGNNPKAEDRRFGGRGDRTTGLDDADEGKKPALAESDRGERRTL